MPKICLNGDVWDAYRKGFTLNEAITEVFSDEIKERVDANAKMAELTPMQMVMLDAGIKKTGTLNDIMSHTVSNSAYTSGGVDVNQWLFPAWVETTLREKLYDTDYLPYLVSTRIGIDGNTVQSPTLDLTTDDNKRAIKKARIAEGADIPTGKIKIGSKAITLWKRGRAIELTYEAARRMRIELFMIQMSAIASDLAHQEIEAAVDVIANGDGNSNAAKKLSTTSTAATVTAADIIDGLIEYAYVNHFNADTLTVPKKFLKTIANFTYDSQLRPGSMLVPFNIPQINFEKLNIIGVDDLQIDGKDALLYSNRSKTLIRYQENGSNIQEMDRFIRNQTQLMTLTENSGYSIGVANSNMYTEVKTTSGT